MNKQILLSKNTSAIAVALLMLTTFAGCTVIGDIFKAGIWVGIIFVVVIIAILLGIMRMFKK